MSLAIPHWGAAGAVVAFGVARLLSAAWLLRAGIRELEFRFPAGFALKVVAASVGAAFPVVLAGHALPSGWASLALLLALGLASFLVLYKLLGGMGPEDRSRLSSGIPSQLAWLSHLL